MILMEKSQGFHNQKTRKNVKVINPGHYETSYTYSFRNFFHPFVETLIAQINKKSLPGVLDAAWQETLKRDFFDALYAPKTSELVKVESFPKEIDVSAFGPYANYNWELFFHIPLTIAVHLSKSRRFAEAQHWFHYIFNPMTPDNPWNFLAFSGNRARQQIDDIILLLSKPDDKTDAEQQAVLDAYTTILNNPFQPHAVARTRHVAYQYSVVMKYLDNLLAWGDHLFQQDTVETINEATQLYVLAANLLGPKPQRIPPRGVIKARTFAQLKSAGLGGIGNALVDLEGQFSLNVAAQGAAVPMETSAGQSVLFGIGRALYFCIPRNEQLLGYWGKVGDRLFKIRHCMNIAGVVRPLALFEPPLDPGMLVKAAAAGIDIGTIVNGLNAPVGPVRAMTLLQKALELCGEVRGLGGALLSAVEKGDAEKLGLLRQGHEINIQTMTREVRFLQWKAAQEATISLLTSRKSALQRWRYYQRVLGLPADPAVTETIALDRRELTEENFDEAFAALVGQYEKSPATLNLPALKLAGDASPGQQAGASGEGKLYLNANEDAELNKHLPTARDSRLAASVSDSVAAILTFIPDFDLDIAFWGIGGASRVFGGAKLHDAVKGAADILRMISAWEQDQAGMASRTAGHQRRADDWTLQYNLAAQELLQLGRQILTSLIAEQIAHHEYLNVDQQIANVKEVNQFLHDKFTNEDLYLWMQGEISRLYYEYYRFAFDTARKAERAVKQELMRQELDSQDFVKFNYWDAGRKGLLSGEALHLDVKRMELAYHENNKRELELTRHVSLRQLDPLALLMLKGTGTCQLTVPEWLFDIDCPGHYMRRIKSVAVSIPSVVGQYTSVNCTLSLQKSSLRKSPVIGDGYARQGAGDERFVDYVGAVQAIVTSSGQNDSGMFEANLRDERMLPFEGAGVESTWQLELPMDYPQFDYATISDVILHIRYTARPGVVGTEVKKSLEAMFGEATQSNLVLLFNLRYDFPSEWAAFVNSANDFSVEIRKEYFPYFSQKAKKDITINKLELYDGANPTHHDALALQNETADLKNNEKFTLSTGETAQVMKRAEKDRQVFLLISYSLE